MSELLTDRFKIVPISDLLNKVTIIGRPERVAFAERFKRIPISLIFDRGLKSNSTNPDTYPPRKLPESNQEP